jgi:putative (di)nucleoside polyphosphate hydrolase
MFRKAVGAIVYQGSRFLLIERVMGLSKNNSLVPIEPEWDIVKGGIEGKESDVGAIKRELFEETGSRRYKLLKRFKESLTYYYPTKVQVETGFEGQVTTIFLAEYLGKADELRPGSEEIRGIGFYTKDEVISRLKYPETNGFFKKHAPEGEKQ